MPYDAEHPDGDTKKPGFWNGYSTDRELALDELVVFGIGSEVDREVKEPLIAEEVEPCELEVVVVGGDE